MIEYSLILIYLSLNITDNTEFPFYQILSHHLPLLILENSLPWKVYISDPKGDNGSSDCPSVHCDELRLRQTCILRRLHCHHHKRRYQDPKYIYLWGNLMGWSEILSSW